MDIRHEAEKAAYHLDLRETPHAREWEWLGGQAIVKLAVREFSTFDVFLFRENLRAFRRRRKFTFGAPPRGRARVSAPKSRAIPIAQRIHVVT